ncbi:MAG: hypothetical protein HRT64_05375 [Erythrobacter sp.]|nr:hypothetical protein [Erythrobacter sp.]
MPEFEEDAEIGPRYFMSPEEMLAENTKCTVSEIEFRRRIFSDRICDTIAYVRTVTD